MSRPILHIAIVGWGSAGQAAALMLSDDGHRVEVFERAAAPGPVGAGFLLQPTGLGVLHEIGLLSQALAHGAPVLRLHGDTPSGRTVMDMAYADLDPGLYGLGMQRGALFEILRAAWQGRGSLHTGQAVTAVEAEQGRLRTADGAWHGPYDLIITADGAASALRTALGAATVDRPYPWGALWCLLPLAGWQHGGELRQRYRAARKMIGLLPVGTRPGDPVPRLSFFWSLPVGEFEATQSGAAGSFAAEVESLWPEAAAVLKALPEPGRLARASYRDAVLGCWHRGRLVAIGDAAHAMSPQLGQGVNMALLDAWALRQALRAETQLPSALARYERERRAHVGIYHFWSRWLTPLFQSAHDRLAAVRDLAFAPMGRLPFGRGHMLRVLTGTQHGVLGRLPLTPGLREALAAGRAPQDEARSA
ncbi:FAD-dependent oxidoreductase [Eleftheria terrae]|uniref:FAD-dependent oxidoreductase n=1 Tax=Eleftheria terrae TaxID=1597781 RepID=UPI00263A4643|nr:NAD(P)/FAD-dependent oxidoreductase [Eleftheria terrae]WKB52496.1 FAD-dependent monooxygenase [Eleftheria terrae]